MLKIPKLPVTLFLQFLKTHDQHPCGCLRGALSGCPGKRFQHQASTLVQPSNCHLDTRPVPLGVHVPHCQHGASNSMGVSTGSVPLWMSRGSTVSTGPVPMWVSMATLSVQGQYLCGCPWQHCQYRASTYVGIQGHTVSAGPVLLWVSMATLSVPMWVFMRVHTVSTGPVPMWMSRGHTVSTGPVRLWVSMATLSVYGQYLCEYRVCMQGTHCQYRASTYVDVQGQHCQYRAGTSVGVHGNTGSIWPIPMSVQSVYAGDTLSVQGQYLCGCPGATLSVQGRYFCGCPWQHWQYLCGCLCGCTLSVQGQYLCGCPGATLSVQGQYLCGCPGCHIGSTWSVGQHISYWWSMGLDIQNFCFNL